MVRPGDFNESARQQQRIYSFVQVEGRSDGADHTALPIQSHLLADTVNGFDAGAMRAEKIPEAEFLQLTRRPVELFVVQSVKMKPAESRINRRSLDLLSGVFERVDDACMTAAG